MKEYEWRGFRYQIADSDLKYYPGAVEVKKPETKAKEEPKNKASQEKENK